MFLNGAGSKGARLRGFPRIVAAAADGGISLTSFDEEGEEGDVEGEEGRADRQAGLASRNDDDDGREGRKAEQKTANELTCGAELRPRLEKYHVDVAWM